MTKVLNKILAFNLVLAVIVSFAAPVYAECIPSSSDYFTCLATEKERALQNCLAQGLLYDNATNKCVPLGLKNDTGETDNTGGSNGTADNENATSPWDDLGEQPLWNNYGNTNNSEDVKIPENYVELPQDDGGDDSDTDGGTDVDGSPAMNITTTVNENGNETTVTEELNSGSGYGSGSDANSDSSSADEGTETENGAAAEVTTPENKVEEQKKEEKEEDLSQYTGLYNGRQILPDIMARHCKIKGEDVAKDVNLYISCVKQYVSEMNSSNATAKADAEKDFQILRYKGLLDAASNAMVKSQSVLNYEETMNKYLEANQEAQTEFDDNHAMMETLSFVTDVLNSFRSLQVEQLKHMAIDGIANIDPSVIGEMEKEEEQETKASSNSGNSGTGDVTTVNVEVK